MSTYLNSVRTEENQNTAIFTGEGAYHGSTKPRNHEIPVLGPKVQVKDFYAGFTNICDIERLLPVPSQEEIKNDGVTFMWCSFEEAKREAGPLTKKVLLEMEPLLTHTSKFIYIDSKIQFFHRGDLPVDSKLWHVDGSLTIRDHRAWDQGYLLLHDLKGKLESGKTEHYMAYQSSEHCATEFATDTVAVILPECIPSFDIMDEVVRSVKPRTMSQPASSIVKFTDNSLHRAVPAKADGWRLWIRCIETDRDIKMDDSAIKCYNTVFSMN